MTCYSHFTKSILPSLKLEYMSFPLWTGQNGFSKIAIAQSFWKNIINPSKLKCRELPAHFKNVQKMGWKNIDFFFQQMLKNIKQKL